MNEDPLTPLDVGLGIAVLAVMAVAVLSRSRTAQGAAFLGLGVLMSLVWLRVGSVDLALAEAALGQGLLSAFLVWLAVRSPASVGGPDGLPLADARERHDRPGDRAVRWLRPTLAVPAGVVLVVVVCTAWLRVEQQLPRWREPLSVAMDALPGVSHEVTAVLLSFRAYDTLLESAVLMFAGIAAACLGRDPMRAPRGPSSRTPHTLGWIVRLSAPVLLLAGLWLLFVGSSSPGGAFQSGALLAGTAVLLHTAGVNLRGFIRHGLRPLLVAGVIAFILAGLAGPLLADPVFSQPWLAWDPAWAFAAILAVELLLTAGIAAGLFLLYLALEDPEELLRGASGPPTEAASPRVVDA